MVLSWEMVKDIRADASDAALAGGDEEYPAEAAERAPVASTV